MFRHFKTESQKQREKEAGERFAREWPTYSKLRKTLEVLPVAGLLLVFLATGILTISPDHFLGILSVLGFSLIILFWPLKAIIYNKKLWIKAISSLIFLFSLFLVGHFIFHGFFNGRS